MTTMVNEKIVEQEVETFLDEMDENASKENSMDEEMDDLIVGALSSDNEELKISVPTHINLQEVVNTVSKNGKDLIVDYVRRFLGNDTVSVELSKDTIYQAIEEAEWVFNMIVNLGTEDPDNYSGYWIRKYTLALCIITLSYIRHTRGLPNVDMLLYDGKERKSDLEEELVDLITRLNEEYEEDEEHEEGEEYEEYEEYEEDEEDKYIEKLVYLPKLNIYVNLAEIFNMGIIKRKDTTGYSIFIENKNGKRIITNHYSESELVVAQKDLKECAETMNLI